SGIGYFPVAVQMMIAEHHGPRIVGEGPGKSRKLKPQSRIPGPASSRYLLSHAVKRPETPREHAAVDGDDATVRETFLQRIDCRSILRIIPHRQEHALIADVEVRVARGNAETFAGRMGRDGRRMLVDEDGLGLGDRDDLKRLSILIGHGTEAREIFL